MVALAGKIFAEMFLQLCQNYNYHVAAFVIPFNLICNMTIF